MDSVGNYIYEFTRHDRSLGDEQVISKVLSGQKRYFELLVRRHNQQLFRIARAYLPRDAEAEDAMQEAYLKAYEKLPTFEGRSKFSTWLIRILINCALARKRQLDRRSSLLDVDQLIREENSQVPLHEATHPPVQDAIDKGITQALEKAIDQLPQKYRVVFMMRMIERMSSQQTARCLGLTNENVKIRLHRAKKMLKARLEKALSLQDLFGFYLPRCDRVTGLVMSGI